MIYRHNKRRSSREQHRRPTGRHAPSESIAPQHSAGFHLLAEHTLDHDE